MGTNKYNEDQNTRGLGYEIGDGELRFEASEI